jgi:hypothetical protein
MALGGDRRPWLITRVNEHFDFRRAVAKNLIKVTKLKADLEGQRGLSGIN